MAGHCTAQGRDHADVQKVLTFGYLHAQPGGLLTFASPIHARVFLMRCHQGVLQGLAVADFKSFIIEAVRRMDPQILRDSKALDKSKRLLERQWQMEFYR